MTFLKRLFQILISLMLVAILGMAGIALFVDPNDYKSMIEQKISEQTGRHLTIKGPITWKWSPILSLHLEEVQLDNLPPQKDKLFSAKAMQVEMNWESVVTQKIALHLNLKGVETQYLPTSADIEANLKHDAPYLIINGLKVNLKDNGNVGGNFKINLEKMNPQTLTLEGDFLGKNLKADKIKLDEIKGKISAKEGLVNITPMELKIAQSVQHATLQADLRGKVPKYVLTQEGRGFEVKHLLALFDVKDKLEGKTNLKTNLSASGNNLASIRSSLSGQVEIEMGDGKFHGMNVITLLKTTQSGIYNLAATIAKKQNFNLKTGASALSEEWKSNTSGDNFTPFKSVKALILINNGLVKNSDLAITHPEYGVTGQGTANLVSEVIDYHASVLLKNNPYPADDKIGNYLYTTPLSIKVQGTFQDPLVRPDLKTYKDNAMRYVQKNVVEKMVQKKIENTVEKIMNKAVKKEGNEKIQKTLGNILDKIKKK